MSNLKDNEVKVTIPPTTVLSVAAILLGLWLVYQVREVVFLFLTALAIVIIFSPLIKSLQRYIPRKLAIALLYILLILAILIIPALMLPPIIDQFSDLLHYLQSVAVGAGYSELTLNSLRSSVQLLSQGKTLQALSQMLSQFSGSLGSVYSSTRGIIGGLVATITVFITSFYLLLDEKNLQQFVASFIPHARRKDVARITDLISIKMGDWLRGQFLLMVLVGALDGIALAILGAPYALLLGLWAGITEAIPFVGPIIGAVPGVFFAFSALGLVKGLIALLIYLLVQQLEANFLVPRIMGRALGLSPVVIIFALLIGGKLFGLLGVIISVPFAAALAVIFEEWRKTEPAV